MKLRIAIAFTFACILLGGCATGAASASGGYPYENEDVVKLLKG